VDQRGSAATQSPFENKDTCGGGREGDETNRGGGPAKGEDNRRRSWPPPLITLALIDSSNGTRVGGLDHCPDSLMTSDGEPARLKPPFEDVERFDAGGEVSGQYFWYGEPEQCLGYRLVAQTRIFRSVKSAMAASVASSFSASVGMR
jgi:hypothetical protein